MNINLLLEIFLNLQLTNLNYKKIREEMLSRYKFFMIKIIHRIESLAVGERYSADCCRSPSTGLSIPFKINLIT